MTTKETQKVATGSWSDTEDERLKVAVTKHGPRWTSVAAEVGTRNGEQCAKRWNDYVNPDLDHSPWSLQEDQRLLPIVALYGHNWKHISENFLPTRAPLAIKNRFALLMRRQKRQTARLQQRHIDDTVSSALNTPPSAEHHSCDLELVSMQPSSLSSSTSGSERASSNGTADMPNLFPVGNLQGGLGQTFDGSQNIGQDVASMAWQDENIICNNLDLSSLYTIGAGGAVDNGQQSGLLGSGSDPGLEFSVTCSRSMLKAMVCHAFDGAMSETAGMPEEQPVTVTLRLKK
ncbi:hypothetical protein K491DRAFT_717360 [Lophiostoma macrostomum CBS 122681]|uniref:Uncharacterized protein n=1 Tax=Lophiostoma macrostomum CBS 122681 TaxID=1314788 RepID=A0A6A6T5S3_9PLEO|nr:hypothetical protein K491DRAFT_717360 [Lophiostoma macrostomum CBS 122681]